MEQFAAVVTVVVVLGACVPADPVDEVAQEALVPCPAAGCNSPIIATYEFHDLSKIAGVTNAEGFSIVGFHQGSVTLQLDVVNGRIVGHSKFGDYTGTALKGAFFRLQRAASLAEYDVEIEDVDSVDYWAMPTPIAGKQLERYKLRWGPLPYVATNAQPVCVNTLYNVDDTLGLEEHWAVVYEGDRIDRDRRIIYGSDKNWFNIGCSGHALAKLALTGHSSAGLDAGFKTDADQRQAMLKMLSADYCGGGKAFTVPGMRVEWHDAQDYNHYISSPVVVEARWTKRGAYCLNTPRIIAHATPTSMVEFPDPWDSISTACGFKPPPCNNNDVNQFDPGSYLISANPVP